MYIPIINDDGNSERSGNFQIHEINPYTMNITKGFAIIPSSLTRKNGFFSYQNGEGNFVYTSNFRDPKYRCSGSCVCKNSDNEENRRFIVGGAIIISGLTFIAVASSIVVANRISREFYDTMCEIRLKDFVCDEELTVSSCEEIDEWREDDTVYPEEDKFMCEGFCKDNKMLADLPRDVDCKSQSISKEVQMPNPVVLPEQYFQISWLRPFCNGLSYVKNAQYICSDDINSVVCKQIKQ